VLRGLLIHEYLTEGRSVKAVAERLGIGVTSAKAALRANGIAIRRAGGSARAVPRDTDHRVLRHVLIQEYVTDERSARSVAARLGIGTKTVLAALRATDIPVRQAGGRARRPRDPETAGFLSLATEWHGYWCGHLLALRPYRSSLHPHRFRIRASLEDLPHIEDLRVGLGSDAPIRTRSDPRRGDACFLQIESRSLAEALARWGVTPTNWAAARWPRDVPPRWRAAHLRGYLEAAAMPVSSRAEEGCTVSALGSQPLRHDLRNCLAELHIPVAGFARVSPGRGAVHLSIEWEDAARLFRLLYADAAVWNPSARRRISERLLLMAGERDRSDSPRHLVEAAMSLTGAVVG
jgi:transposase